MANSNLFSTRPNDSLPAADARNGEGAPAYELESKHALAQYAATGCLNGTFYATAEEQLAKVLELATTVDAEFVAKTAVLARERGHMKDVPALLCAVLAVRDVELLAKVFPRVVDTGRMLRTFVQIVRSGAAGRRSLGTAPRRLVREWFAARDERRVFVESVGRSPSLADVLKMVHPKPTTAERAALYGYLIGRAYDEAALPHLARELEAYKAGRTRSVPDVPFQMLTALDLDAKAWAEIARNASWQTARMNLNTFARHGAFGVGDTATVVAARLRDRESIRAARAFPYQLLVAHTMAGDGVPESVRDALHDAMEIATENVPSFGGKVYVMCDVSGSMASPVTGRRRGATTAVRCVDVAALVASAVLRKNRGARVLPFEHSVVDLDLDARDSVMTNARKLAAVGGGGTNCSAPLELLNREKAKGDLVIYVSDNESWVDANRPRRGATATLAEWAGFRDRNPDARLVCVDVQPNATTQARERPDVLNIGGFSDHVFDVIEKFATGRLGSGHWVGVVDAVEL